MWWIYTRVVLALVVVGGGLAGVVCGATLP